MPVVRAKMNVNANDGMQMGKPSRGKGKNSIDKRLIYFLFCGFCTRRKQTPVKP